MESITSSHEFATMSIGGQWFGVPVLTVQYVLKAPAITRVPLAQPEIAGSLNLRGRIVTAIDMRIRLGLPPREDGSEVMSVVVEHDGELYSLLVDQVGDVLSLPDSDYERSPAMLGPAWREVAKGIYRLEDRLMVVLDIPRILAGRTADAA